MPSFSLSPTLPCGPLNLFFTDPSRLQGAQSHVWGASARREGVGGAGREEVGRKEGVVNLTGEQEREATELKVFIMLWVCLLAIVKMFSIRASLCPSPSFTARLLFPSLLLFAWQEMRGLEPAESDYPLIILCFSPCSQPNLLCFLFCSSTAGRVGKHQGQGRG